MRRDVRLLGDILGEVVRDSDPKTGPDLLADVERLRHAVIEARDQERRADDPAGDAIAALVASWDLDRAEQVARAFTVYFHLANLAEEHQRIRHAAGARRRARAGPRVAGRRRHRADPRRGAREPRRTARAPGADRAPHRGPPPGRGGGAAPHQRAAEHHRRRARRGGRARRGAPRAARERRPAVADLAAPGQGHGPDRRGPDGHDRVRRDAVPGRPRRVPRAGPGPGRTGNASPSPRTCASAAGWARTGTATRS